MAEGQGGLLGWHPRGWSDPGGGTGSLAGCAERVRPNQSLAQVRGVCGVLHLATRGVCLGNHRLKGALAVQAAGSCQRTHSSPCPPSPRQQRLVALVQAVRCRRRHRHHHQPKHGCCSQRSSKCRRRARRHACCCCCHHRRRRCLLLLLATSAVHALSQAVGEGGGRLRLLRVRCGQRGGAPGAGGQQLQELSVASRWGAAACGCRLACRAGAGVLCQGAIDAGGKGGGRCERAPGGPMSRARTWLQSWGVGVVSGQARHVLRTCCRLERPPHQRKQGYLGQQEGDENQGGAGSAAQRRGGGGAAAAARQLVVCWVARAAAVAAMAPRRRLVPSGRGVVLLLPQLGVGQEAELAGERQRHAGVA